METTDMETTDTVVAGFADHRAAESAVKELIGVNFEKKKLSVVGKGQGTRIFRRSSIAGS